MIANGILYQLAPLAPRTLENASGSLPTQTAQEPSSTTHGYGDSLTEGVFKRVGIPTKKYPNLPTPTSFDCGAPLPQRKKHSGGGQKPPLNSMMCSDKSYRLNPQFVEVMMGFPQDWTEVENKESNS